MNLRERVCNFLLSTSDGLVARRRQVPFKHKQNGKAHFDLFEITPCSLDLEGRAVEVLLSHGGDPPAL